jgi:dipeptidyl-peptidase-4
MFHRYMAQEGWIVFMVDGRGTGGRGRDFRQVVARRLGDLEADDQLAAVDYLKKLDYVDPGRIALWGWSYGGYVSTMALLQGKDALAAAIAVSPVSDWRFYDTLYTERYMGLPQENAEGYDAGSLLTYADRLERPLLLIHGSGDDNVHPQNSLRLMTALQEAGKPFELMIYPDKAHAIAGDKTRYHLYKTMHDFLRRVLAIPEPVGARR